MTTRSVLVLGATGGIGRPVARLLQARGWNVRAMHRDPDRLTAREPFTWVKGDALIAEDVALAAEGVSTIIHAVKPRHYADWHRQVLPMIENSIAAARGGRIVVPGNVYNYGPDAGPLIDEDAPQHPTTRKGKLRVALEERLEAAARKGESRALIVRAGDFFGPGAGSSWLSEAMIRPGRRPRLIRNPAAKGVGHQWAYLPDLAETMVRLIEHDDLPDFARFHMDGHWDADGTGMAAAIARALGDPPVPVTPLPWGLIRLVTPFMANMRELLELKYLWDRQVRLNNARLVATLAEEPHTPLDEAVHATVAQLLRGGIARVGAVGSVAGGEPLA